MIKLELDIDYIEDHLQKLERNRAWLGRKIKASNSSMVYIWNAKPISQSERIAEVLGLKPKNLIKEVKDNETTEVSTS